MASGWCWLACREGGWGRRRQPGAMPTLAWVCDLLAAASYRASHAHASVDHGAWLSPGAKERPAARSQQLFLVLHRADVGAFEQSLNESLRRQIVVASDVVSDELWANKDV